MTQRLYYTDSYLRRFSARVVEPGSRVVLDQTAFYPASGGQPFDTGSIAGRRVTEVVDEGDRIAHLTEAPVDPGDAECEIDWPRRFDHMQQHSGQHLLSAVFVEQLGVATLSFHLGVEASTIDLDTPALDPSQVEAAERRANQIVCENRAVRIETGSADGLRKTPERSGALRTVAIDNLDRTACGGTHVRSTGEIGPIAIRKLDRVRQTARVEFLCGFRALARTRADFAALSRIAHQFSAPLDDAPSLVDAQAEALRDAGKQIRRLRADLAAFQGRELYDSTAPGPDGLRRLTRTSPAGVLDDLRPLAQNFCAHPRAVFLGVIENPPAVLLAASADSGVDAAALIKSAGLRGGGTPRLAQAAVPTPDRLAALLERLAR
ncbi:MAG: alanyl-tRNA editing protein [Bryobacteraceae bacterium]